jgi:hypothetical protein
MAFSEKRPIYRNLTWLRFAGRSSVPVLLLLIAVAQLTTAFPQTPNYPKEIRGYKVERRVVELRKPEKQNTKPQTKPESKPQTQPQTQPTPGSETNPATDQSQSTNNNPNNQSSNQSSPESDEDGLIRLGTPKLVRLTPLGITFEVPIVVAAVKQSGHVDFLMFEDMVVNGTSVQIAEYHREFDLPNKNPLTLAEPLRIYIYLPNALLAAALGDWSDAKETWPVTGRVYVFGKFKKYGFSFKRCIPVELNVTMRNPLRER